MSEMFSIKRFFTVKLNSSENPIQNTENEIQRKFEQELQ